MAVSNVKKWRGRVLRPFFILVVLSFLGLAFVRWLSPGPPLRGEIEFPVTRPVLKEMVAPPMASSKSGRFAELGALIRDRLGMEESETIVREAAFGDHLWELRNSEEASAQARVADIEKWAEVLQGRFALRYPELTPAFKSVLPEENGFLQWLLFQERLDPNPNFITGFSGFEFPSVLQNFIDEEGPWDDRAMEVWRAENESLLQEILAIGLLPNQSINLISPARYHFLSGSLAMDGLDLLQLEIRYQIERGQVDLVLKAVRAARGLAHHFIAVEAPTLLGGTLSILIRLSLESFVLKEILPLVPPDELVAHDWELALLSPIPAPTEMGRLLVGEWYVTSQRNVFPFFCDSEDPKYPRDPAQLLDYLALTLLYFQKFYSSAVVSDWSSTKFPLPLEDKHLSKSSAEFAETYFTGLSSWARAYPRVVAQFALNKAAFELMKGGPLPLDPVYGQRYVWDPITQELGPPATLEFRDLNLSPIIVPHLP